MKSTRVIKASSEDNLPLELWGEIMSTLPVKPLLRFRCVSKPWKALIDDPKFCRLHLSNCKDNLHETQLFVVQSPVKEGDQLCVVRSSNTFETIMNLASVEHALGGWDVICSVDGIVVIEPYVPQPELILWNPSIRRDRVLPPCPVTGLCNIHLGIGFVPSVKDYKLLRLCPQRYGNSYLFAVYTVGTGLWKTVEFQGQGISAWRWSYNPGLESVCFRGVLYFVASNQEVGVTELVSFDLSDEVFASTSLPVVQDPTFSDECTHANGILSYELPRKAVTLVDGGRLLGLVYLLSTKGCMWVMETSGAWTKLYAFNPCIQEIRGENWSKLCLLYVKKNIREMVLKCSGQVMSYNLENHHEKTLVNDDPRLYDINEVCGYVESLLLLNG